MAEQISYMYRTRSCAGIADSFILVKIVALFRIVQQPVKEEKPAALCYRQGQERK